MFISKKHVSRRTLLRGAGAAVALPFLDSMVPAQTALSRTAAKPKPRLTCIEIVHGASGSTPEGIGKHYWQPEKVGRDFEFGMSISPLEPFRDYVTVVSGTDLRPATAYAPKEEGADHFRGSATFLTAAHVKMTEGSDIYAGTSMDQYYAQQHGQDTPLPSIQLCIENQDASGACDYGYSCVYSDTISWASPTTPLPMTIDPRMVFENLFGDGSTAADRLARHRMNRSILDGIMQEAARLQKGLDTDDKRRLNNFFDNIREVERRIERIEKYNASGETRALPAAPFGVPDSWEEHVKLMFDLQYLAFTTETTRVSAFKLSRDVSGRVFPESGVKTGFHSCSHHAEVPTRIAEFAKLNLYHVSMLPYFLNKLKDTPDGDGNLLDHSLVLYGSPMGDSNVHNHKRVPLLLIGKANGAIQGNNHVLCKDETPIANVLLSVLHRLNVNIEKIGDSTGDIAEI